MQPSKVKRIGDQAMFRPDALRQLAARLVAAADAPDPHGQAVAILSETFAEHFPALCEVVAETIRAGGRQRLHYWCDVAEMADLANYHFVLE